MTIHVYDVYWNTQNSIATNLYITKYHHGASTNKNQLLSNCDEILLENLVIYDISLSFTIEKRDLKKMKIINCILSRHCYDTFKDDAFIEREIII